MSCASSPYLSPYLYQVGYVGIQSQSLVLQVVKHPSWIIDQHVYLSFSLIQDLVNIVKLVLKIARTKYFYIYSSKLIDLIKTNPNHE